MKKRYLKIVATGSYLPEKIVKNSDFLDFKFIDPKTNMPFDKSNEEIISKFKDITNIEERRWVNDNQTCSDIAAIAARDALDSGGINGEDLDFIIVAHNFGDIKAGTLQTDTLPSISNKVKAILGIKRSECICHDIIAGCPGWTQAMITANAYIKSGDYNLGLIIGADTLSRIIDESSRDAMIFADGAGATIVKAVESETPTGLISSHSQSDSIPYANILTFDAPIDKSQWNGKDQFIYMEGRKVYVYALSKVPSVVKTSIEKAGIDLSDIKKVLIHQANEKMDEAILERIFKLYGKDTYDKDVMPMTINKFGNSSVATVPTMLDLIVKENLDKHVISKDDYVIFASVGAGMNINSIVYRI
ncbi:MAG: 3-oxoacyl-ACP synthase III family protein [Bacteroidales bacterium]